MCVAVEEAACAGSVWGCGNGFLPHVLRCVISSLVLLHPTCPHAAASKRRQAVVDSSDEEGSQSGGDSQRESEEEHGSHDASSSGDDSDGAGAQPAGCQHHDCRWQVAACFIGHHTFPHHA